MPLIQLLEVLIVVGVLLWLVNRFIPMQSIHQVNFEWRGSDCHGSVAPECFWAISLAFQNPRRSVKNEKQKPAKKAGCSNRKIDSTQHGRHLPQGDSLKTKLLLAAVIALSLSALAQTNSQTTVVVEPMRRRRRSA